MSKPTVVDWLIGRPTNMPERDDGLTDEKIANLARDWMQTEEFQTHPFPRVCLVKYVISISNMTVADSLALIDLYFPDDPRLPKRAP